MDEIKRKIKLKIETALSAISSCSTSQSDEHASATVLNLVRAYDFLKDMEE